MERGTAPAAVIFDLDGTLLDTLQDITNALNCVFRSVGLPTACLEEVRLRVGWGVRELVRRSVPPDRVADLDVDALTKEVIVAYRSAPMVHTVPYPGINSLLVSIRSATIKTAVLSNKPDDLVQVIVEDALPRNALDRVFGRRPESPPKPDPASTCEVLAALGVKPDECLFVGDSEIDMETARNAGCVPVAVTWGFRDVSVLREAGAVYVCNSAEELRELLGLDQRSG